MTQRLLISATVLALLWCPFRCLEAAALGCGGHEPATQTSHRCACCTQNEGCDGPKSSVPMHHSEGCQCPDCVCEGAVVDGHALIGVLMMMPALNTLATSALVVPGLVMDCREVLDEWRLFTPSGPDLVILYGNIRR
jgi:hypothetical protein